MSCDTPLDQPGYCIKIVCMQPCSLFRLLNSTFLVLIKAKTNEKAEAKKNVTVEKGSNAQHANWTCSWLIEQSFP